MLYVIDDILEDMAFEGKKHFSPHYICERAGIDDLKEVTEYMSRLVGQKLRVTFEVECPDGDSDFAVDSPKNVKEDLTKCHVCGREYYPDPEDVWVVFDFVDQYKDYVKKKGKNKQLVLA